MKSPGRVVGTILALVFTVGCQSGCAGKVPGFAAAPEGPPNVSRIVRLSGRWSLGSGCPVGPRKILTAAHVVDARPFDRGVPLAITYFAQGAITGRAYPEHSYSTRDVAVLSTELDIEFYPIAAKGPEPGEALYFTGYDWRDTKRAFAERTWEVKALRTAAGALLIYDPAGEPGTSGSCVLNAAGEVVAINVGGKEVGKTFAGEVGVGVLVAGESF
jgi:V8-like Glu-specific endopeptidase